MENKFIIAFTGKANAGKDTCGSIVNYISKVGVSKANYEEWKKLYNSGKLNNSFHFATNVKKCLSIIFGIEEKYFNDREYKDKKYYCIEEHRFIDKNQLDDRKYEEINIEHLKYYTIKDSICNLKCFNKTAVVTLRTLMQYFATEIGRNQIHENIWIYSTIADINLYLNNYNKVATVTDLRFYGEAEAIYKQSWDTYIVKVNRPDKEESFNHISEQGDFDVDYTIDNTSSLMALFYKVIKMYQELIIK
jgi:hypothetical protein